MSIHEIDTPACVVIARPTHIGILSSARKQRVIDFIERNLGNHINLSDLASTAALSPTHFCRAFRRTFGVSPVRYVWHRRIEAAKLILRQRTASLTMVALACGFSSASHFSTAFRDATGVTPAKYMWSDETELIERRTDA